MNTKTKRRTAVILTVLILMFLWSIVAWFCWIFSAFYPRTIRMDDFSETVKSCCHKGGLLLNESCEFVTGFYITALHVYDYRVIFRAPEDMDLARLSASGSSWQNEPQPELEIPKELRDTVEGLTFYRMGEEAFGYGILYRSDPKDGYIYFYLSGSPY